jgi:hypothetical protein
VEAPRILKMMLKRSHSPLMDADESRFVGGEFLHVQSAFIRVHQRPTSFLLFQQTLKPGQMVAQASACDLGQQP